MNKFFWQYKKLDIKAKAVIWFTICSFLQKGISFITVPVFARIMPTSEYGLYTVYLSWLQILTIFTSLYMYNGTYDNALSKYEKNRNEFTSSMLVLTLVLNAIVLLVVLCGYKSVANLVGLPFYFIIFMFGETILTPAVYYWSERKRFEYDYRKLIIFTISRSFFIPIVGILFTVWGNGKAEYRIIATVLVEILFCLPLFGFQLFKGKTFFNKEYWKYALSMSIPILPHYLSGVILNQGDRIMIDKMVGKEAVAYYGLAYSIGMIAQILVTAINSAITPWMYEKFKQKKIECMKQTITALFLFVSFISIFIMLISPELILIFGSNKYMDAAKIIPPVSASVLCIFMYNILSLPQFYYEKTKFFTVSSVFAAVINILLNWIFIRQFGYVAAGYTTLICYILYALGHWYISKKILEVKNNGESMISLHFIIFIFVLLIAGCIVSTLLIKIWVVRYALIFAFLIILIMKKNKLLNIYSAIKSKGEQ